MNFTNKLTDMKTNNGIKIYIVLKNEEWDGENWDEVIGAYFSKKEAQAVLQAEKAKLYDDWKDEIIDEDSKSGFFAHREGEWNEYHIELYINDTILK